MLRFSGTNVMITGAASEIGWHTAYRLLHEGAAIYAVDRDADGLDELSRSAGGLAGRVATATLDVTDETAVAEAVDAAAGELGGLDVLINVAGTHRTTPIESLSTSDLRELFELNCVGTAVACREALRHLPDHSGVIVNVASSSASHGNPYMTAYSASKGAVLAFSLSLAAELVGRGIRVVPISPGQVSTPLTAGGVPEGLDMSYYGRIRSLMGPAHPQQVAGVIAFAASRDASYLTGAELRVDGGSHI